MIGTSGAFQAATGGKKMKSKKKGKMMGKGQQKGPPDFMMQAAPNAGGKIGKKGARRKR